MCNDQKGKYFHELFNVVRKALPVILTWDIELTVEFAMFCIHQRYKTNACHFMKSLSNMEQ